MTPNADAPIDPSREGRSAAVVANLVLFGLLAGAWVVEARWPNTYYRLIPEDEPVEWATFWAEVLASLVNGALAWRSLRLGGWRAAWYEAGIALFCFLVAGEEISWGQRVLGFQPPAYFLANNIQLEANAHNLVRPWIWSAGIEIVIAGFGVALPLLLLADKPAALARRLGVYGPPASWVPGFAFVVAMYVTRPYYLCEEVVELAIGVGLGLAALRRLGEETRSPRPATSLLLLTALGLGLGFATTAATDRGSTGDEALIAEASAEIEALRQDFVAARAAQGGRFLTECNLQARLHSLDPERALFPRLRDGDFHRLVAGSAPKRADYLLDPWNMPYWISDQCDSAARYIMLLSFGPNRRRESTDWAVGGDDVATYAFHLGEPRAGDWRALGQADQVTGH